MNFLSTSSLRWRLLTVMALAYILVAVATEIVGYTTQQRSLRNQLVQRAQADARILATASVAVLSKPPYDFTPLHDLVREMKEGSVTSPSGRGDPGVIRADVLADNGCYVATTFKPKVQCPGSPAHLVPSVRESPNGDIFASAPIVEESIPFGNVEVVLSNRPVTAVLTSGLYTDLLLRTAGLILFLLLALAISQYVLGPLTVLARAATAIRHGQLGTRVPAEGGTELMTVSDAFNSMADALEQRIRHLSFLAAAASVLPGLFRDKGDISYTFTEFCRQMDTVGLGILSPRDPSVEPVWFDLNPDVDDWHEPAHAAAERAITPTASLREGWSIMSVPVLDNTLVVTARRGDILFSQEEQQVVTNFAYQVGTAADNARLFEAQQEALQVKDQFLSIVSHELRTPLTTIKGYSQMLTRKITDDPSSQRFANNIDIQVSRLSRLVDDLLDVTRYSRGQFELKRHPMDFRPVLEDIISRFRLIAPTHRFELHLDSGSFEGVWDRDRLEQVMNNLIGNAVKYSPAGGTVTVTSAHIGDSLRIAVRDEGVGISEDEQRHLFERFFRGSAEGGNVNGMGLGLYVTQRIVDAHGGSVGVNSTPGQGSEFFFTLPLASVPAALSR